MPTKESMDQIELGELIASVDNTRVAGDAFKLPAAYRTLLDERLTDLKAKDVAIMAYEGDRAEASANVRVSLDKLGGYLRDGFNFIRGIGAYAITDAQRLGVFTHYGWASSQLGELTDARIEMLANTAITATPSVGNPAWQYPAPLLALITAELATLNANQPLAQVGNRQMATAARDEALVLLRKINDRVRFFYCSASDDEDKTLELARIGRQPRRAPGTANNNNNLPAPTGLTLDSNPDFTVDAQWDPVENVDHYLVFVQRVGIDDTFAVEPTTFEDIQATLGPYAPATTIRIKVRAVRGELQSADSEIAEIQIPPAPPPG